MQLLSCDVSSDLCDVVTSLIWSSKTLETIFFNFFGTHAALDNNKFPDDFRQIN